MDTKNKEDSCQEAIAAIQEDLELFDDWTERYQYLIEEGRAMPPMPEELMTEEHKVPGCQSQVWIDTTEKEGKLIFQGASDAAIVQGLVALVLRVYSHRTPKEILETSPVFLKDLGLIGALSANRGNGVSSMAAYIQTRAKQALEG
ncbi:SufE family protein [Acetobacteraceae bacterium]|nr:SufE family protein [Acetobacteraceae bacterium]